jgi:hypothetical protein
VAHLRGRIEWAASLNPNRRQQLLRMLAEAVEASASDDT